MIKVLLNNGFTLHNFGWLLQIPEDENESLADASQQIVLYEKVLTAK